MTQHHDQLGTRYFTGKLEAAEHIIVDEVSRHAPTEDVSDTLIEYQLVGNT